MSFRLIRMAQTCLPALTTGLIVVACTLEEAGPTRPLTGPAIGAADASVEADSSTDADGGADAGPDAPPPPPPPSGACYAAAWGAFCAGASCCEGNAFACNGARNEASSAHSYCCFEMSYACEETSDYWDCMEGMGCDGGIVPPGPDPCEDIIEQSAESWEEACQMVAQDAIENFIESF